MQYTTNFNLQNNKITMVQYFNHRIDNNMYIIFLKCFSGNLLTKIMQIWMPIDLTKQFQFQFNDFIIQNYYNIWDIQETAIQQLFQQKQETQNNDKQISMDNTQQKQSGIKKLFSFFTGK